MCESTPDGTLVIRGCLDGAGPDAVFGDLCNEWDGSQGWITLFYEDKQDNEEFQRVNDDTIVVFCKFYEPDSNCLTYLGCLLMKRTMRCSDLLTAIVKTAEFPTEKEYNLYKEEAACNIQDVTGSWLSLEKVLLHKIVSANHDDSCL